MQTRSSSYWGRVVRVLLLAGQLIALAYVIGALLGLHSPAPRGGAPAIPVAGVAGTGADNMLALEQAAQSAETAAEARNPHNQLFTADHAVYASVGVYDDCTGQAALTHAAAAIDTCVTGVKYFIGHNPGVFTGLMTVGVGGTIGYYDGSGRLHRYRVVAERTWPRTGGVPPTVNGAEAAQFQTCVTADGSVDRILDAVEI